MSQVHARSRRALLAPLLAAAAVAVPAPGGALTVGEACAQSGTCLWDASSVCFVDGVAYPGLYWSGGGT